MIRFNCSVCGKNLKVADELAGKAGKCPSCGERQTIPYEHNGALPELIKTNPENIRIVSAPQSVVEPVPVSGRVAPRVMTVAVRQRAKASHSLGIASFVLGLLAFVICWVPIFGLLSLPLSLLGTVLGGIGLLIAIFRRGSGIGFPIAGTCLSLFSIVALITITGVTTTVIDQLGQAMGDSSARPRATRQTAVSWGDAEQPNVQESPSGPPAARPDRPENRASAANWRDAQEPIQQQELQVRVTSVTIGRVPLKDVIDRDSKSQDELLMVRLELTNLSSTRKMDYISWSGKTISFSQDYATIEDNFGNSYKRINFGFSAKPVDSVDESASIYPGETIADVLVFERPIDSIEFLRIEFPAENFGGSGMLRVEIPKKMIIVSKG